jgi:hypothetical protein
LVTATETAEREANEARLRDLREDFQRQRVTAAIKALTPEDRQHHVTTYMVEAGEGSVSSWNPDRLDFTNSVERAKFSTWLRMTVAPAFDEAAFKAWAKSKRGAGQAQP